MLDACRRRPATWRTVAGNRRLRLLGGIIAGGQSSRFGSDKGRALLNGRPLIDHVIDGLKPQVETIVIVGRDWPGIRSVADRPAPNLGPLGGLCGALHLAKAGGFDAVLSAPCDTLPVPTDMPSFLPLSGGVIEGWPLLGLWPVALTSTLDLHLAGSGNRSMMGWIKQAGLAIIAPPCCLRNFNTPADLEGFELP